MFNTLLSFLLNIVISIASAFIGIIGYPVYLLISIFIPNLDNYMNEFNYFVNHWLLDGLAFAREVFFNCTGYPRALLYSLILLFLLRIEYHTAVLAYKFVVNVWSIIRGKPIVFHAPGFNYEPLKKDSD